MDFDHSLGLIQNVNSAEGLLTVGGTGAFQVPTGTTAQRPGSAGSGALRINSTSGRLELLNNSTWNNVGTGDVTSIALSLPSIFSVTGSPITTSGTLSATLNSQSSSTVLAAPAGSAGTPAFRQLSLNDMSDVTITSPASTNILSYNGTKWANQAVSTGSASTTLSSWTSIGGSPTRYTANFAHNLGTFSVVVSLFDTTTNQMILPDKLQLTDANNVLITLGSNTRSIRVVVIANGMAIAATGSSPSTVVIQEDGSPLSGPFSIINFAGQGITAVNSGGGIATVTVPAGVNNAGNTPSFQQDVISNRPTAGTNGRLFLSTDTNTLFRDNGTTWVAVTNNAIERMSYRANTFNDPNNSDWIINSLASSIADPLYNSLTVRSFDQTTEQGVGLLFTPPLNSVTCTITFKGRAQTAPGAVSIVQPRLYRRLFVNGSAGGAWSAAFEMGNISIPTSTNMVYNSQTFTLAALGWTAGALTLLELTRKTTGLSGGTNLASAFLLYEFTLEFN